MSSQLGSIGLTLINTIFNLFTFLLMLRFALQASRADTLNPATQGVLGITDWLIHPIQRSLRPIAGRFEYVTAIAAVVTKIIGLILIFKVFLGVMPPISNLLIAGFAGALNALITIYFFALIILIILSWVAPTANHPAAVLILQLTQPVMEPLRRIIPPLGMFDLTPIVAFIVINLLNSLVISRLVALSRLPAGLVIGY